jgi:Zn-dependent peptidase ImmA (M78 family)
LSGSVGGARHTGVMVEEREAPEWTNVSVLALAQGRDPIEAVVSLARDVVLEAVDSGWTGPPYDPLELADLLGLRVRGRNEVNDARTVALGERAPRSAPLAHYVPAEDQLEIQFNPTRPRARLRYSIAHEIAHTLFPDAAETVRHRTGSGAVPSYGSGDAWQLELLCNLAAGELLVPASDLPSADDEHPVDVPSLMRLRGEFGVSTEAMLRRAVTLARRQAALIATTPVRDGASFRVDYVHAARGWTPPVSRGQVLTDEAAEALRAAAAIGHVAADLVAWPAGSFNVQAVGIPPWPDDDRPRVLAVVQPVSQERLRAPALRIMTGDATEPSDSRPLIIAHIVNDRGKAWGPVGFARQLTKRFPDGTKAYQDWAGQGHLVLGRLHVVEVEPGVSVASLVAQEGYGRSQTPRLRYPALAEALDKLADYALDQKAAVQMPPIGAGFAGGDWSLIADEIDRRLCLRGVETTIFMLNAAGLGPRRQA